MNCSQTPSKKETKPGQCPAAPELPTNCSLCLKTCNKLPEGPRFLGLQRRPPVKTENTSRWIPERIRATRAQRGAKHRRGYLRAARSPESTRACLLSRCTRGKETLLQSEGILPRGGQRCHRRQGLISPRKQRPPSRRGSGRSGNWLARRTAAFKRAPSTKHKHELAAPALRGRELPAKPCPRKRDGQSAARGLCTLRDEQNKAGGGLFELRCSFV